MEIVKNLKFSKKCHKTNCADYQCCKKLKWDFMFIFGKSY